MKPRPYQTEAKRECYAALRENRSALVALPTGTGKGAIIGFIIGEAVRARRRVLAFVHREEIVEQLAAHAERASGIKPAIERAERSEATDDSQVVVASVQSLVRRLDRFPSNRFDLLIYDECHHGVASQPMAVLEHFAPTKYIGFTATPNRGDERALGQVFDTVAYDMTISDAIREGWLTPIHTRSIKLDNLNLASVRRRRGEFAQGELGSAMSQIAVASEAIEPAVEIAGHRHAIVFCVTRAHMHVVVETVRRVAAERSMDLPVAWVDGTTPKDDRRQIMADFRSGKIRWLVNVEVATEGFDAPAADTVIMLRPTFSRALYAQMVGRSCRPLPGIVDGFTAADMAVRLDMMEAKGELAHTGLEDAVLRRQAMMGDDAAARRMAIALSAKPHALVLDFTDSSERHDLASMMDLLGGDYTLPERSAAARAAHNGEVPDLLRALEQARRDHESKLADRRARAGDPFALFGIYCESDRWARPATRKQMGVLSPLAIPRNLDIRQANAVLAELDRRDRQALCTYQQAALLARLRHPVGSLLSMTRRDAGALVRALAERHWFADCGWEHLYDEAGLVQP